MAVKRYKQGGDPIFRIASLLFFKHHPGYFFSICSFSKQYS